MGFYSRYLIPPILDRIMRAENLLDDRRACVGGAEGRVLEIGIGSGLNLPYYTERVSAVVGVDPSVSLQAKARKRAQGLPFAVEHIEASAEAMPLDDASVDTVVTTWSLCSIPDPIRALGEARRVLKPSGRLLFVEHGISPEARVARWQHRLNGIWRCVSDGCNMNRKMDDIITRAGFAIETLDTGYMEGPKLLCFLYRGSARPA